MNRPCRTMLIAARWLAGTLVSTAEIATPPAAPAGVRQACFSVTDNERGPATRSWQLPGQTVKTRKIKVEDKPISVDLGAEK